MIFSHPAELHSFRTECFCYCIHWVIITCTMMIYISLNLCAHDGFQAIRTKLRELDHGWDDMNSIYTHERNKKRSKLSVEEVY